MTNRGPFHFANGHEARDASEPLAEHWVHATNSCPSLMDLASFVDGHASQEVAQSIAAHMETCAVCREAHRDHQEFSRNEQQLLFVPPQVIAKAMALIGDDAEKKYLDIQAGETVMAGAGVSQQRRRLAVFTFTLWRGAAAAALIGVCVLGHHIGASIPASNRPSSESLVSAVSFGVLESEDQAKIELELLGNSAGAADAEAVQ